MDQLSLFAADLQPPAVADLAGLLAGTGQSVLTGTAGSVSVVVDDGWRVDELRRHLDTVGLRCAVAPAPGGTGERVVVTAGPSAELLPLLRDWRRGSATVVPAGWMPTPGQLRLWVLIAGHTAEPGCFHLLLDPAVHLQDARREALLAGLGSAGVTAAYVGPRGGGPLARITSRRMLRRLSESVGGAPAGAPPGQWP